MFNSYTMYRHRHAGRSSRFTILLLLALLLQTVVVQAQYDNRPHYQLLWRIEGPGLSAPSYLFGTMHLTDRRVFEFSDSVLAALQTASSFAMEVNMDSMMAYMLSPGGPILDTSNYMIRLLDPDEYRYVDSLVMEKAGVPIAQLRLKHFWFVEKLLIDEEEALGKDTASGREPESMFLDGWLHQKATRLDKPVHSLEKITNQLPVVSDDVSEAEKDAFLWSLGYRQAGQGNAQDRADRLTARAAYLDNLVELYYEGDLQKIQETVNEYKEHSEVLNLESRNQEMAVNLSGLIRKGSVFAAVGVAHLPGAAGIISLLREKGYRITPVEATFTGMAQRDLSRLDSLKGYSLSRVVDGYSVTLPGVPIAYPIPNVNRKMYIGGNDGEAGFAFSIDVPMLAADKRTLVNSLINNMARQGNAVLKTSYPITYRNIPGTEAVLQQRGMPYYIRLFIRNNRAFVFMHSSQEADSSARKDFFHSVRFYDIVRPVAVYDTLLRPQLGFSVLLPAGANHAVTNGNEEGARPEEAYAALDDVNHISYVLRVEKMQSGYYNINDHTLLQDLRKLLLAGDSTLRLIDSAVVTVAGLPLHTFAYQHANGYVSRLQFIPRGNLAYCLLCVYDSTLTDSRYWQRFQSSFRVLPLQAQAPVVPFVPEDSSFSITGPGKFSGRPVSYGFSSPVERWYYTAMDSISYSMYTIEVERYSPYHHINPDSLLKTFLTPEDATFIVMGHRRYISGGRPAYEAEMKGRHTGLHMFRKAVVAGHTIYRLTAIQPEELAANGHAQQFFAAFRPGSRQQADTLQLQRKKLSMLLRDLQSSDSAAFAQASAYLRHLEPDSSDVAPVISTLARPFPADTGESRARVRLLLALENVANDSVVAAAERLFRDTEIPRQQKDILRFLNGLATDSAVRTFLRLAPALPESAAGWSIFSYTFKEDSLYQRYLPAMIATAGRSRSFLRSFTAYTNDDSLWMAPRFEQYGLERLVPGVVQLFEQQLAQWKNRAQDEDSSWYREHEVLMTGQVLALPGMPAAVAKSFRVLLADSSMSLRALAARGLINRDMPVHDSILNSILANNDIAYTFIQAVKKNKKLPAIRHLLSQELLGRAYVAYYLSDDYYPTAIEQVTRVKVPEGKGPAASLILYRYQSGEDEDWHYLLNGPHPPDAASFNLDPELVHPVDDASVVTDKEQLSAMATRAYHDYLEQQRESH
ncbi:TraB/GumN family protein [Chitinophaga japonensis]|uniref:Uncharacterized protein YbaP (TraB family) n=1 Tax=Chitinophaga japonensis TaxID=104662 RepID=A0A562T5E7_CHIJA|nr:TraB/GumN family protein [Chitinophaga japonensis]TWI88593.1 uncharacterized protein YbaP (TraB family) [Chitinophaga japonensis]